MTLQGELIIFLSLCLIAGKLVGLPPFRKRRDPTSDWWAWYNAYLQSPEWKIKRKAVLLRSGGRCEICGNHKPIQCHHLRGSYARIPHEHPWDLAALCFNCHKLEHELNQVGCTLFDRGEHPGKRF